MNRPLWDTFMQWRESSKEGYSTVRFAVDKPKVDDFTKLLNSLNSPYIVKETAVELEIITINYFDYIRLCSDNSNITDEIIGEYFE